MSNNPNKPDDQSERMNIPQAARLYNLPPELLQEPERAAQERLEETMGALTAEDVMTHLKEAGFRVTWDPKAAPREIQEDAPQREFANKRMPKAVNVGETSWDLVLAGLADLNSGQPSRYPFQSRTEIDLARDLHNLQQWCLSQQRQGVFQKPFPHRGPILHAHLERKHTPLVHQVHDIIDQNTIKTLQETRQFLRRELFRIFTALCMEDVEDHPRVDFPGKYTDEAIRHIENLRQQPTTKELESLRNRNAILEGEARELRVVLDTFLTTLGLTEKERDLCVHPPGDVIVTAQKYLNDLFKQVENAKPRSVPDPAKGRPHKKPNPPMGRVAKVFKGAPDAVEGDY